MLGLDSLLLVKILPVVRGADFAKEPVVVVYVWPTGVWWGSDNAFKIVMWGVSHVVCNTPIYLNCLSPLESLFKSNFKCSSLLK